MNKYKEKISNILNKIKGNKRVLYLTFCTVLVLFCLVLNVTFAKYITKTNKQGTNITIGNMNYIFAVNSEFEALKSNIYNDRIIRVKASTTQRYYVSITAQNKYASKYELNYRVCASYDEKTNTCTYADSLPDGVRIAYAYNTPNKVSGSIEKDETKIITLYTNNTTSTDVYLELTMNAGYIHNELKTLGSNYNLITEEFENPQEQSIEIKSIIAYANGEEVESYEFPSHGNFSLKMTCYDKDGNESTTAHADGYWSGTKWVVNVNSATENTICYAKFTTTTTPIPNFQYLVNGTDVSSNSAYVKTINDGNGNWRIKFFESGTFIMSYPDVNYIDVFVVGGGGAGGNPGYTDFGANGGAGGYTKTCRYSNELNTELIAINKDTNYTVTIGAGGASVTSSSTANAGNSGGSSSAFNCLASGGGGAPVQTNNGTAASGGSGGGGCASHHGGGAGGSDGGNGSATTPEYGGCYGGSGQGTTTREFGESTGDLYAGGGGGGSANKDIPGYNGPGGAGGAGGGGKGTGTDGACASGVKNTGGGGGGKMGWNASGVNCAGGSGIVIIRNHRV